MFYNLVVTIVLAAGGLLSAPPAIADEGGELVILTITGNVTKPNRGPLDPFEDAIFAHLDIKFDRAYTFTLSDLKSLPQKTLKARYKSWPREVVAIGPAITDVLHAAGAGGKKLLFKQLTAMLRNSPAKTSLAIS